MHANDKVSTWFYGSFTYEINYLNSLRLLQKQFTLRNVTKIQCYLICS